MDIVTLGAALNGSAEYVNSHFKGGSNIQIVDNPDGTQTINASGEVSAEDTVARADIAAIKDGETLDSFGDVETALGSKQDTISDLSTIRSGAALGATAVQPETGKGLSTNDYTTTEKTKLAGIAEGAEVNVQANWTQTTSTADDYIKNKPTLGTAAALDVAASGNASTSQVVKGNDTRLTDARNAADVSSWAKAANKPSYNGSEIALTGYTEAQSKSSVAATDTANAAIGKLEYRVETNENNISFTAQSGVKNFCPSKTGANTSGNKWVIGRTGDNTEPINLPIGSYIFTATSTSTGSGQCQIKLKFDDGTTQNTQTFDFGASMTLSFTTSKKVVGYGIYANPAPVAFDNMMIRPSFTDSIYDEYAMSNAELTAKEQVNENNILLIADQSTQYNLISPSGSGSQHGFVVTDNHDGTFTVNGTRPSGDTTSVWVAIGQVTLPDDSYVMFGANNQAQLAINVGGDTYYAAATPVIFTGTVNNTLYIHVPSGISSISSAIIKPIIIKKALYDAGFTAYQPYALSNVELTSENETNKSDIASNWNSGKNKIRVGFTSKTYNTVAITNNGDGTVTINGTNSASSEGVGLADVQSDASTMYDTRFTLPEGTYHLYVQDDNSVVFGVQVYAHNGSNANVKLIQSNTGGDFTYNNSSTYPYIAVRIIIGGAQTYNNFKIYPMICEKSVWDASHKFEQYALSNVELTELLYNYTEWTYSETTYSPTIANAYEYTGISFTVPANEVYEFYVADRNDSSVNDTFSSGIIVSDSSTNVALKASTIAENTQTPAQAPNLWLRTVNGITPKRSSSATYYIWVNRASTSTSGRIILAYRKMALL